MSALFVEKKCLSRPLDEDFSFSVFVTLPFSLTTSRSFTLAKTSRSTSNLYRSSDGLCKAEYSSIRFKVDVEGEGGTNEDDNDDTEDVFMWVEKRLGYTRWSFS